ncbi:hypothetical protein QAD02_012828 [Eretmocerus hayati]|uniref:Uncharacterized protein n=1 Tax=Eretmocerus hayati TaxID=131215 RepID=A0ACC2P1U9_9HYME|nr:hypothetical protein QAD02_012828 [Eretmocerus hayati]
MLEKVSVNQAKKRFTKSNTDYEIVIQNYSSIFCCGEFDCKFKDISFKEIPSKNGLIRLKAYLKDEFTKRSDKNENEILGVVTDGENKLDVIVRKSEGDKTPEYERGTKLEIYGDLQEDGMTYVLKVKGVDKIKELSDAKMKMEKLILANEIFVIEVI